MGAAKKKKGKRKPCPSCGLVFQKGHTVTRLVAATAVRQVVCNACWGLVVHVLASDAPAVCQMCHAEPARVCIGCMASALDRENQANLLTAALRRVPGRKFKKTKKKL